MRILGIDIGISSIGWALIEEDETRIVASGVRLFKQSTDRQKKLLNLTRRQARGRRRTLLRKRQRLIQVRKLLVKNTIVAKKQLNSLFDNKLKDIWQLRDVALKRKLTPHEFARVLLHIAKHRCYQSNRKVEQANADSESKKVLGAIEGHKKSMHEQGALTIGSYLYHLSKGQKKTATQEGSLGSHQRRNRQDNNKPTYNLCVSRDLLRSEIDVLFAKQLGFGNQYCTQTLAQQFKTAAFSQKPITFKKETIGKCLFEKEELRAAKSSYSAEWFVVLSRWNATRLLDRDTGECSLLPQHYTLEQLKALLHTQKELSYATLRKKLKMPESLVFSQLKYEQNFEYAKKIPPDMDKFFKVESWLSEEQQCFIRSKLQYEDKQGKTKYKQYKYSNIRLLLNNTRQTSLHMSPTQQFNAISYDKDQVEKEKFGKMPTYHQMVQTFGKDETDALTIKQRDIIASELSYGKDDQTVLAALMQQGIARNIAEQALGIKCAKFINLSLKALSKIVPLMETEQKMYFDACSAIYGSHSALNRGGNQRQKYLRALNKDENYQLTNPTVKRAFSQFRKVVNAVIKKHGALDAMHIECVRELKHSLKKRQEIERGQRDFKDEKQAAAEHFKQLFDREPSSSELLKWRFYSQQDRKCIYSGQSLDEHRLLEVGYTEIDHILPYSRSFDNSLNNKALCLAAENQQKRNRTAYEYITQAKGEQSWAEAKTRFNALKLPLAKRNKLLNQDLPNLQGNDFSEDKLADTKSSFIARNLVDTSFIARFCKNFVEANLQFTPRGDIKQKVKTRSGALTSQLRHNWGIAEKNRDQNYHHAEDAIIVAFSSQTQVQRLSTAAARSLNDESLKNKLHLPPPIANFNQLVTEQIKKIFISYAPRHKVTGAAHQENFVKKNADNSKRIKVRSGYVAKGDIKRCDVFLHCDKYLLVPLYAFHFTQPQPPDTLLNGDTLPDDAQFQFSLFKDDLIEVTTKKLGVEKVYIDYIRSSGRISYIPHHVAKLEKERTMAIGTIKTMTKLQVDVLGGITRVRTEKRMATRHPKHRR